MKYLKQLCKVAKHPIDLTKLSQEQWIEASIKSTRGDYEPMAEEIRKALI